MKQEDKKHYMVTKMYMILVLEILLHQFREK